MVLVDGVVFDMKQEDFALRPNDGKSISVFGFAEIRQQNCRTSYLPVTLPPYTGKVRENGPKIKIYTNLKGSFLKGSFTVTLRKT